MRGQEVWPVCLEGTSVSKEGTNDCASVLQNLAVATSMNTMQGLCFDLIRKSLSHNTGFSNRLRVQYFLHLCVLILPTEVANRLMHEMHIHFKVFQLTVFSIAVMYLKHSSYYAIY